MDIAKIRLPILFPTFFLISSCCDCQPAEEIVEFESSYCESGVKEFNVIFLQPIDPRISNYKNELNSRIFFEKWRTFFRLEPYHTWPTVNFYSKNELKCSELHPTDQGKFATMVVWTSENDKSGFPLPLERGGELTLRIGYWSDSPSAAHCAQAVFPKNSLNNSQDYDIIKREFMYESGAGDRYSGIRFDIKDVNDERLFEQMLQGIAKQSSGYYASGCYKPWYSLGNPINRSDKNVRFP